MRWLMLGVGAIGGYVGGSLALSGETVTFLERAAVAENLRQQGLRLQIRGQRQHLQALHVVTSLAEAFQSGRYDVAVLAVKSYDTAGVLEMLLPHRADLPPLLSLQNGVENEVHLEQALGQGQVLRGTVTSAIGRQAGEIVQSAGAGWAWQMNMR